MSAYTKQMMKEWGPWLTLALWLLGHALTLENRLSKVEQKVDDIKVLIEQHNGIAADPH